MTILEAARIARRYLPKPVRIGLHRTIQMTNRNRPGARVNLGNVAERAPFSDFWGWDRGQPVDRFYIDRFIAANERLIKGSTLEVQSALYSDRLGEASDVTVLDIDVNNERAHLNADLNVPDSLPSSAFDCVIFTQVLQYTEPVTALRNIGRSLRPGGRALITVPCLSRIDPEWPKEDMWRWTPMGLNRVIENAGLLAAVEGFGNSLSAAAFMLGLSVEDVGSERLVTTDAAYPVVACAVVQKG